MFQSILIIFFLIITALQQEIKCNSNCALCNLFCQRCQEGYFLLKNGECIMNSIPNCQIYKKDKLCQMCEVTWYLANNTCVKDFSGCIDRSLDGSCLKCGFGTQLVQMNCLGIINCQQQKNFKCIHCRSGYILKDNICIDNSESCIAITQSGVCRQCAIGYKQISLSCELENKTNHNCILYGLNNQCIRCLNSFILKENKCVKLSQIENQFTRNRKKIIPYSNLVTPIRTNKYQMSYTNINFTQIFSISNIVSIPEDNCFKRKSISDCEVCIDGYQKLNNGLCIQKIKRCIQIAGQKCIKCSNLFKITDNNECSDLNCKNIKQLKCKQCKDQYILSQRGICVDPNCVSWEFGICKQCKIGHKLNKQNLCKISHWGCEKINTDGECSRCGSLLHKLSACIDIKCLLTSQSGCLTCHEGYQLQQNGICKDPNCKTYNNGICYACEQEFTMILFSICLRKLQDV